MRRTNSSSRWPHFAVLALAAITFSAYRTPGSALQTAAFPRRADAVPARPTAAAAPAPAPLAVAETARLDAFGFPERAFAVLRFEAPRDLSTVAFLVSAGLDEAAAERLAAVAETTADLSAFEPGAPVHVYRVPADTATGAPPRVSHVVYEPDVTSYVVLKPGLLPVVQVHARPTERAERLETVDVSGSLARTFERAGLDERLADTLSAVFARRFDMGRLRRGDAVSIVFEEERIGSLVVSTGDVLAVRIVTGRRRYEAFRFEQDGVARYFNADGESFEDAFRDAPLEKGTMTSAYSLARFHPIQQVVKPHYGTDYAAPIGTPVLAIADGTVTEAGFGGGNGNYVMMKHEGGYTSGYLHFSKIEKGVRPGLAVERGDVIGYVGMTGLATGPHVCFRFKRNGAPLDFLAVRSKLPPAPPVARGEVARFHEVRDALVARIEGPTLRDRLARTLSASDALAAPVLGSFAAPVIAGLAPLG